MGYSMGFENQWIQLISQLSAWLEVLPADQYGSQPINIDIVMLKDDNITRGLLLLALVTLSLLYLIFTCLQSHTLFALTLLLSSSAAFIYLKLKALRSTGLLPYLPHKMRAILLQKSIMDIFSDFIYFPYITKIIGAFMSAIVSRPHPARLRQAFSQLDSKTQDALTKKGLLSLAPSTVESLVLSQGLTEVPDDYGRAAWEWQNARLYEQSAEKVHLQTLEKRVLEGIDRRISGVKIVGLIGLTCVGLALMKRKHFRTLLINNATFSAFLLSMVAVYAKINRSALK